jgi:hypothetical protein
MMVLRAEPCLSIITNGSASLVMTMTSLEVRFKDQVNYLLISFRSEPCFDFSTVLIYIDLCISIDSFRSKLFIEFISCFYSFDLQLMIRKFLSLDLYIYI